MIWKFKNVRYIYVLKPVPHEPNISPCMSACSLRESSRIGWFHAIVFYATGGCRDVGDKAGFHAIELIGGVDDKP